MTPIYAGGGRRSTAPSYNRVAPVQSQAREVDPELLRQAIFGAPTVPTGGAVSTNVANNPLSELSGRGSFTGSGQGGNFSGSTGVAAPGSGALVGRVGAGLSALGMATGNPGLSQVGGMTSFAGNLSNATRDQALGSFATAGAQMAGLPGGVIGLARAAINADPAMAINSALSLANPALGAINGIASMFGIPTLGSVVSTGLGNGPYGSTDFGGNFSGGGFGQYGGDRGPGGSSGEAGIGGVAFGPGGDDSDRGSTGGSSRGGGGYGGGIGQSGGDASGAGSFRA